MKPRNLLILILAVLLYNGCNTALEDPDTVPAGQTLQLTAAKDTLLSGGKDMTVITARVPKLAGIIPVTFTTTAGTFIYSGTKTVMQLTDSLSGAYRYANTVIKSDTSSGPVYIVATATTTMKRISITFKK